MSTVVVVRKNGIAAIGADTLAGFGGTKESSKYIRNHSKLVRIGKNILAPVGQASWQLVLESYFEKINPVPLFDSPRTIFEVARDLQKSLEEDYFLNPVDDDDDAFESLRINTLIANKAGIFGLYDLRSVQEYTQFYAFGTGREFALGAMRVAYQTKSSAKSIAQAGLEAACDFDDCSGLPFEIKTIKLDV